MKLYLAGPVTGYPERNFPAFTHYAAALRAKGHAVTNPAELNQADQNSEFSHEVWLRCMRTDIRELVECGAIVMMPGWEKSRGAALEYEIMFRLGQHIYVVGDLL